MISERGIRCSNNCFCIYSGIKPQDCMHSFINAFCAFCGPGIDSNYCRFGDARLFVDGTFHIVGKDVEPFRRDDHFFLAAANEQPALCVLLSDVTGMKPSFVVDGSPTFSVTVITAADVLPAYENLSVVGDLDLYATDRAADRSRVC